MSEFWSKIKESVKRSTEFLKNETRNTVKVVSEKTPQVASNIAEKTKEIASAVAEKTEETISVGKLKVKLYNFERSIDKDFSKIGGIVYELFKAKEKNVYENKEVEELIDNLKKLKNEVKDIEKEIQSFKKE